MNSRIWGFIFRRWVYWLLRPQYIMLNRHFFRKKKFLERMLVFARKHKIKVLTFTANSPEDWYNALEYKLNGVITDYPKEACEILTKHTGVAQGAHHS